MSRQRMRLISDQAPGLPRAIRLRRMAAATLLGAGLTAGLTVATAGPANAVPGIATAYGTAAQALTVSIANDTVTVMVHGLTPGEAVTVYIASTPTLLGPATATLAGVVDAAFPLPAGLAVGLHTVTVIGPGTNLSTVVTLTGGTAPAPEAAAPSDPTPSSTQLPHTGADVAVATALGAILVAGGGILLLSSRRRRRAPVNG